MMQRRVVLGLMIAIVPFVFSGCGGDAPKTAKATGKVTFKGQPLKGATVKLYPETGPIAVGITDDNGVFSLSTGGRAGAPIGLNKVSITKMIGGTAGVQPATTMTPEDMRQMAMSNTKKKDTGPKSEIPLKYSNSDTSALTADVDPDGTKNDFVFDLQ